MPIIAEQPKHAGAIETLLDQAFGVTRAGKTVYRLRHRVAPVAELCFVSVADESDASGNTGLLEGTIRYWPVTVAGTMPALLLGPVAVAGDRRCAGLGATLIEYSLARAAAFGHRAVLLVGDAPYYNRFGFTRRLTRGLTLPGPVDLERFLGLELQPGALEGVTGAVGRWTAGLNHQPADPHEPWRFQVGAVR